MVPVDEQIRTQILYLDSKLQELQQRLTSPTTPPEAIWRINEEIQMGQDALEKLRRALKLEQQPSQSESPAKSGPSAPDTASRKL